MPHDNTDSGALFKNDKKGNENWPDYRGKLNVGGDDYWISAWLKTSKKGQKYMSLSVQPVDKDLRGPSRRDDPDGSTVPF